MKNDNSNIKSKHRLGASGTVALMMLATVIAKGLGLLRSVLMANYYGAGMLSNAFSEASHIPLTFFDLLFATAISGVLFQFITVLNGVRTEVFQKRRTILRAVFSILYCSEPVFLHFLA